MIVTNDDINSTTNWCSSITTSNLQPGTYFIEVKGFGNTNFAYSLLVNFLDNFTNTVLDSTCATAVTAGSAPFSGCYSPETSFASLANAPENGKWSLKIVDDAAGDLGTLNSRALVLCTTP